MRYGSTISSLWPTIEAVFCVATTLPVTLATNIGLASPFQQLTSLPRDDDLFVGRHDPNLRAAGAGGDQSFAARSRIGLLIEHDAQFGQIAENGRPSADAVLANAAGQDDGVGAPSSTR